MLIQWSMHSRERLFERLVNYRFTFSDVELCVKEQRIKIKEKNKIKTIFKIDDRYFTVVKKEDVKKIVVITIWESNLNEVKIYHAKNC